MRKTKPRPPNLHVRAWWCMREMAVFALQDLLATVADGSERGAQASLQGYINALEKRDVLRSVKPGCWRLHRDLGPKAPVRVIRLGVFFDLNAGRALELKKDKK